MKQWYCAAALAAAVMLSGCKGDAKDQAQASPGDQAQTQADATEEAAPEASEGVLVSKVDVAVEPSFVKGNGPEWAVQIAGKNQGEGFDGLEYRVELFDADERLFATHGSQMWFTPSVAAGADVNWAARIPRQEGQPELEGVTAKVTVLKRLTKEALTEQAWKPLDPDNLPPPREVKLDKNGNIIG